MDIAVSTIILIIAAVINTVVDCVKFIVIGCLNFIMDIVHTLKHI